MSKSHKHQKDRLLSLVRPWGDAWECWHQSGDDPAMISWQLASEAALPDALISTGCIFVLPARAVCSLAARVPPGEDAQAFDSTQLQMEVAGLVHSQTDPLQLSFHVLGKVAEHSIVRGLVFPADYSVPSSTEYHSFVPSPLALELPTQALCLWREGSYVVACITGDNGPIVWESIPAPEGSAALRGWLESLLLEIRSGELCTGLTHVMDCAEVLDTPHFLGLAVEKSPAPRPSTAIPHPSWLPPAILAARQKKESRRRVRNLLAGVGAALGILALIVAGFLLTREIQLRSLRAQVAALEAEVAPSIAIARQWDLLSPSIEPDGFALEKLLLAVSALPADGVRLSVFEALPGSIRIEGDARNVGLASLYFNSLQTQEGSERYSWNMPPPVLQPDNSARFAIDGSLLP